VPNSALASQALVAHLKSQGHRATVEGALVSLDAVGVRARILVEAVTPLDGAFLAEVAVEISWRGFTGPVVDVWAGAGESEADAIRTAVTSWGDGVVPVFTEAARADRTRARKLYQWSTDGQSRRLFLVFEGPLQVSGSEEDRVTLQAYFAETSPFARLEQHERLPRFPETGGHWFRLWLARGVEGLESETIVDSEFGEFDEDQLSAIGWPETCELCAVRQVIIVRPL
jgi:hypothetical protein